MNSRVNSDDLNDANKEIQSLNKEKEKRIAELNRAYDEISNQIQERGTRAAELAIANIELVFQNEEKEKRATELIIANNELFFQSEEKGKRAAELFLANEELIFQNLEKEKRAAELIIANRELAYQNELKEKRALELSLLNTQLQDAEAAVRDLNAELEQRVIDRSAQYNFISQVNQTIVHVKDAKTLFRHSCRIAAEFGKFQMAWIGNLDVANQEINLLEQSGIPRKDISRFKGISIITDPFQSYVVRTGNYFLCNNIELSSESEDWKVYAGSHQIRSCMVLPIKKSGTIVGTFNLYARELDFFDQENINLVVEVAGDISFALDILEKAERHKEAEEIILRNEHRFRALIEHSVDLKTLATVDGKRFYASPSVFKVLGYTPEEFQTKTFANTIHPDDLPAFSEKLQKILKKPGSTFHSQHRLRHKDGSYIWCEGTITNMINEANVNAIVSNLRDVSDKKLTEQQQQFSSINLSALINNTTDLMWSVNRDFELITSNKAFDEIMSLLSGHTIEATAGMNVLELGFPEEQSQRYKKYYERAFSGEAFTEIEFTDSGREYWSEISFNPIKDGKDVIGTACYSHNITDIKLSERQIKESQTFTLGILNSLNYHIAVIEESGEIVAVNEAWKQFALQNGETTLKRTGIGSNYYQVCRDSAEQGDETAKAALKGLKEVMENRIMSLYLEYPCDSPTEHRWFGMRAVKFNSEAPMIVIAHMDISERKLTEENLSQSEARLKEAQALSRISNWELDLVSKAITWSDEFYSITGIRRNEIKPSLKAFLSIFHPEDREHAKASFKKSLQIFEGGSFKARIKGKKENIHYVFIEWRFEFDSKAKPIRLYGILQDITEKTNAEQEREKLVEDMTARNRDLEQFTFIISHNLRAPIANIMGLTEILTNETLPPPVQQELVQALSTSAIGLDIVIKDINTILQVKEKVNADKELVKFSEIIDEITISHSNLLNSRKVQIKSDFSRVDEIFSLKVYLHSIFYNLINNSIKYSKPNVQPIIEIKSKKEKGKIILTFKDNGIGIDLNTIGDKLFGLYKRFHTHVEGKGMGLFLVKTQVEAIGGKITVASEVGVGTEFTIILES